MPLSAFWRLCSVSRKTLYLLIVCYNHLIFLWGFCVFLEVSRLRLQSILLSKQMWLIAFFLFVLYPTYFASWILFFYLFFSAVNTKAQFKRIFSFQFQNLRFDGVFCFCSKYVRQRKSRILICSNVWCLENRTNLSNALLLCLVRFLMHQTLLSFSILCF